MLNVYFWSTILLFTLIAIGFTVIGIVLSKKIVTLKQKELVAVTLRDNKSEEK